MLKLLIIDIDGVMTNGTKLYGTNGSVIGKFFCDKDFTAIKAFKSLGISVCFLSGDRNINESIARNRNIDFYFSRENDGTINKAKFVQIFKQKYNVESNEMGYIGDDIFDLPLMKRIKYKWCPIDAVDTVKKYASVLSIKGGEGVISYLYYKLIKNKTIKEASLEDILKFDKNEKI